jgi:uncharacterized protein YcaQ
VSSSPLVISAAQARRLTLGLSGLARPPRQRLDVDGLLALIEELGFVQVDSVQVVERAHHMILSARNQTYRPAQLRRLIEDRADLFEHWTHDASVIPTTFYPYWKHRFERFRDANTQKYRRWHGSGFESEVDRVLDHVAANGTVMSRDLVGERPPGAARGWWEWHDGKVALEFLWHTGHLAIARRDGFQKVYDLAERVIPEAARAVDVAPADYVDWACRGALDRLGFATPGEIAGFWKAITGAEAKVWCQSSAVVPVVVEATDGSPPRRLFARPDITDCLDAMVPAPRRLRIINPFDPLLRDRKRLLRLFNFDYRIEIFVPKAKRKYGYYVFALLEGERLVGRIDMKADRPGDRLAVAALWMEPGYRLTGARQRRLEAELDRQRRFSGLATVCFADGYLKQDG